MTEQLFGIFIQDYIVNITPDFRIVLKDAPPFLADQENKRWYRTKKGANLMIEFIKTEYPDAHFCYYEKDGDCVLIKDFYSEDMVVKPINLEIKLKAHKND